MKTHFQSIPKNDWEVIKAISWRSQELRFLTMFGGLNFLDLNRVSPKVSWYPTEKLVRRINSVFEKEGLPFSIQASDAAVWGNKTLSIAKKEYDKTADN